MIKKITLIYFAVALAVIIGSLLFVRFSTPEDNWLCQNGQWVKHGQPSEPQPSSGCGLPEPQSDLLITEPIMNTVLANPIIVKGSAKGTWYFEASFPVKATDKDGNLLGQSYAQAQSDWMTEKMVPFISEINLDKPYVGDGYLVFAKDNPSGLPENDQEYKYPVKFNAEAMSLKVYFTNPASSTGADACQATAAVTREIPKSAGVARAAINELLKGPTDDEKTGGYGTSINEGVVLKSINIDDQGTAKVDFSQAMNQVGGSCRVASIRAQIEATLKQFPTVKEVVISVEGNVDEALQP